MVEGHEVQSRARVVIDTERVTSGAFFSACTIKRQSCAKSTYKVRLRHTLRDVRVDLHRASNPKETSLYLRAHTSTVGEWARCSLRPKCGLFNLPTVIRQDLRSFNCICFTCLAPLCFQIVRTSSFQIQHCDDQT